MSASCQTHRRSHSHSHDHAEDRPASGAFRRALWIALLVNAAMFAVEMVSGWRAQSTALLADAIDFAGDSANYAISLWALGAAVVWRSRTAWLKGWAMLGFGALVLGRVAWSAWQGAAPEPVTMGVIGTLALVANVVVAVILYAHREGDANMRSVWLCSRNDAIGNVAVLLAALGVFGTGTRWPDLAVAALMALLALSSGWAVLRQARTELASR